VDVGVGVGVGVCHPYPLLGQETWVNVPLFPPGSHSISRWVC